MKKIPFLTICCFALMKTPVLACSVCFGDPQSKFTLGLNAAIAVLLMILAGLFSLFIKFFINFAKRSKTNE